jgi:hypothetical protein
VTRSKLQIGLLAALCVMAPVAIEAATREPLADPQWPNVTLDGEPQWPNIRPEDLPDPTPNPSPAFIHAEHVALGAMAA